MQLPPYVSWRAFLRTLDSFGGLVPNVVDSAAMEGLSTSLASQMTQAFRFLGLITSDGEPTPEFRLLVEHPESRTELLPKIFRRSYPDLFRQGERLLSQQQVETLIARTGLSLATQRKAVTFVLNAAAYMKLRVEMKPSKIGESTPVVTEESAGVSTPSKKSLTIDLASGGTVQLSIDVDLLRLDGADRAFIFDLIDKLRAYRAERKREMERDMESGVGSDAVSRGDQEVPF